MPGEEVRRRRPQDAIWSGSHAVYEAGQAVSASVEALRVASGSGPEAQLVRCGALRASVRRLDRALRSLVKALEAAPPSKGG